MQIEFFKRTSQVFFKRASQNGSHQEVTTKAKKMLNSIPHIPLHTKGVQHKHIVDNQFVARHVSCQSPEYTILYIHGGGFIGGTPRTYINVSAQLAKKLRAEVYIIKYPLSPEQPFPAAVNHCLDAYQYLLDLNKDPKKIVIMGDSAGGGLTLSTLLKIRDNALPSPRNAVCFSPLANCLIKPEDMAASNCRTRCQ
ncbi:MAG: alpha/beta hydrolase fold domain-containing protein [Flavobacteriales bacterium]|nr:alpha/beta hydrolase fold domain-containing protein [Flavobacteriales bacterium]